MPSPAANYILRSIYICAEARAFLARAPGLDGKHRNAYVRLINGLVAGGVWSKLDALWVLAAPNRTIANLNLISTSFTMLELPTPGTSPAFAADGGYTGVNASNTVYLNTQYNPSTAGLNYTQNSAHISLWSNTSAAANANTTMGLRTNASTISQICCRFTGDLGQFQINDNVTQSAGVAVTDSTGFYLANRSGSSAQEGYLNAVDMGVTAVASSTLSNGPIIILGRRVSGSQDSVGDPKQICAASIGGSLTAPQVTNFYALLRSCLRVIAGVP